MITLNRKNSLLKMEGIMTPSGKQLKAARALAGWDRNALAAKSGLSDVTIRYIENETSTAKKETIKKILAAFRDIGIEFTENDGVRRMPMGIEVYEGRDRFEDFYAFMYEHLEQNGGEVCLNVVDERLFSKFRTKSNFENHKKRMKALVESGKISFRVLATESNSFHNPTYAKYRYQPDQDASPAAFYAFGDCLALISFDHKAPPYVVLHKSGPFAESYRHAFEISWKNGLPPPADEKT